MSDLDAEIPASNPTSDPASDPADNPVEEVVTDDAAAVSRGQLGPLGIAAAIVFGLFYAYALWAAVSQLIDVASAAKGIAGIGLVVPIASFVLAFVLGRRRNIGEKALIYIAGLVVVAALWLSFVGFENYALLAAK